MPQRRVLIIGGGFSGLGAAIMLRRGGWQVDVVEQNPEWTMDGAGISVGGPTLRALDTLGVLDAFLAEGAGCDGTDVLAADGTPRGRFPTPRLVAPDVPGNGAIMRPLLGRILAEAALGSGVHVRLGATLRDLRDEGDHVEATLPDGSSDRYDLVVGADGIHSSTRRHLFPEAGGPRFSGQGAWRAVVPRPDDIARTTMWIGSNRKVGVNPISATEMYLFVNEQTEQRERIPEHELLPKMRALIEPFTDPLLRTVLGTLDERSLILHRPMHNLLLPQPWHRGRVVLIGDAVHATTPHLAAGAGLGLEDAIVLADELARAAEVEEALTAFEARRWERCRMVVENSQQLGELEARPGGTDDYTRLQAESFRALAQAI